MGSPPHLREKLNNWENIKAAGEDHPRTCGENAEGYREMMRKLGSPPHLRGKQKKQSKYTRVERITPAPAGKTRYFTISIRGM